MSCFSCMRKYPRRIRYLDAGVFNYLSKFVIAFSKQIQSQGYHSLSLSLSLSLSFSLSLSLFLCIKNIDMLHRMHRLVCH